MAALTAGRSARILVLVALYAALLVGGSLAGNWAGQTFNFTVWPHTEPGIDRIITLALVAYIVMTALPFVPGIEIGLAVIAAFGPRSVPIVYVATVAALILSFGTGRLVPERWLAAAFGRLGMGRARRMVVDFAPLTPDQRAARLVGLAPGRWRERLLRYRLLALAVLINIPGNALLGGGGGICMAVGISRLVSFPKFVLSVVLAVAPLPVAIVVAAALGNSVLG